MWGLIMNYLYRFFNFTIIVFLVVGVLSFSSFSENNQLEEEINNLFLVKVQLNKYEDIYELEKIKISILEDFYNFVIIKASSPEIDLLKSLSWDYEIINLYNRNKNNYIGEDDKGDKLFNPRQIILAFYKIILICFVNAKIIKTICQLIIINSQKAFVRPLFIQVSRKLLRK